MIFIGIVFIAFVIYIIVCIIQQKQIMDERSRKWEQAHRRPAPKSKEEKELEEKVGQTWTDYYGG